MPAKLVPCLTWSVVPERNALVAELERAADLRSNRLVLQADGGRGGGNEDQSGEEKLHATFILAFGSGYG